MLASAGTILPPDSALEAAVTHLRPRYGRPAATPSARTWPGGCRSRSSGGPVCARPIITRPPTTSRPSGARRCGWNGQTRRVLAEGGRGREVGIHFRHTIPVLVVLDTTELMGDPVCGGIGWRVLAHAVSKWHLRLIVPEVAVAEAVAGYGRAIAEAAVALERFSKLARRLGFPDASEGAAAAAKEALEGYEERLRKALGDAGAEFVGPPEVAHLDLVQRACSRRRPCDSNGDGYRDTLNWLTVVRVAEASPDDEVVWVTGNFKDFADESGTRLHPDLTEDLKQAGVSGRVRLVLSIGDLAQELAAGLPVEVGDDLRRAAEYLQAETVRSYIAAEVFVSMVGGVVDARRGGLPPWTQRAEISRAVGEPREVKVEMRGSLAGREGVAEFEFEADTTLLITGGGDAQKLEGFGLAGASSGPEGVGLEATKPLVYRGLLTLGNYGRPVGWEVTGIEARSEDKGRAWWTLTSKFRERVERFRVTPPSWAFDTSVLASFPEVPRMELPTLPSADFALDFITRLPKIPRIDWPTIVLSGTFDTDVLASLPKLPRGDLAEALVQLGKSVPASGGEDAVDSPLGGEGDSGEGQPGGHEGDGSERPPSVETGPSDSQQGDATPDSPEPS